VVSLSEDDGLITYVGKNESGQIVELEEVELNHRIHFNKPQDRLFIGADPMIATGHSLVAAVRLLCQHGVPLTHISVMALVVSPEGLAVFHQAYPHIPVYAAALDRTLDPHAYIRPGLGDAGDRLFGTL
jgi:uracil phosphoribosyltransferase